MDPIVLSPESMADMDDTAEFANSDAFKRWLLENPEHPAAQEALSGLA